MANRKISDLTALTATAVGDLLLIVDISEATAADKNKKITIEKLFQGIPGNVGIGTSSPSATLDVAGSVKTSSDIGVTYQPTAGNIAAIRLGPVSNQAAIGYNNDGNLDICPRSSYSVVFKANESGTERARIDSSGRLLVGGSADSGGALLQVFGDRIRVGTAKTPASASATGTTGEICWDANYIYVCTATNTWKRTAIATW